MGDRIDKGVEELLRSRSAEEALALYEAIQARRKEDKFICYWETTTEQREGLKLFTPEKKIFGVLGGNRSGKTELGAVLTVVWALGKEFFREEPIWDLIKDLPIPEPPNNIWIVALDYPTLRDVIWREKLVSGQTHPPFLPKIKGNLEDLILKINEGDSQIFFKNGSVITGKSAEAGRTKFQGASVNLVWIDEEPEVEIFDECYQRTVDCGGKILITLTPLTDIASGVRTPWVFDLYEESQKGKKDVAFMSLSVMNNPYVPEEEKAKLLEKWAGHYEEKARLYGKFIQRSGLVYNNWTPAKHLVKPFRPEPDLYRVVCIDPAPTGVTAALWCAADAYGNLYFYREYYVRDKIASQHAKDILIRNGGDQIDMWLIDPFAGRQKNASDHKTIAQLYQDAGIPVRLANLDEDYGVNESREYLQAALEPKSKHPKAVFTEDLTMFRWEISHYTWDRFSMGPQKGLSKDKPVKRDDHLMNNFQYIAALKPKVRKSFYREIDKAAYAQLNSYT